MTQTTKCCVSDAWAKQTHEKQIKPRFFVIIFLLPAIYLGSYLYFRNTLSEVWMQDKKTYVIFPENKILYYVYRPLTIADGKLTGMQFHIGPHQQNGNN